MVIHQKTRLTPAQRKEIYTYQGVPRRHPFMLLCAEHRIEQRFTRVRTSRTNGKAERVIRTSMELWHEKTHCESSAHRKTELKRFLNYYNGVPPHKGIDGLTPDVLHS
jgi:transposase InsO family protein